MSETRDDRTWMEVGRLAELGLLSATLVHELRQPLFAVKALLQLLQERALVPPDPATVATALEQVDRMERILSTQGGLVQHSGDWEVPFPVDQPICAALATLEARTARQGVACTLDLAPGLPVIHGNPQVLQQVVVNLLQNALDALEGQASGRIRVTVDTVPASVRIRVENDGPTIPPADLPRVFDAWFTTKPPGRGTGLGLAIARRLVEGAGGRIEVSSRPGSTSFTLHYPSNPPSESP
ncbi:MAG: GHKL domain-containing protein [Deltaproteobacteria bacterium]|nr:GHKL domain-containing protein [Deltaproteobacteria bacterium]